MKHFSWSNEMNIGKSTRVRTCCEADPEGSSDFWPIKFTTVLVLFLEGYWNISLDL